MLSRLYRIGTQQELLAGCEGTGSSAANLLLHHNTERWYRAMIYRICITDWPMKTVNGIQSDGIETDRIQSDGSSDGANGAHRAQCNSSGIPSLEAGKEAILIMKNKILFNKNASLLCSLLLFCSLRSSHRVAACCRPAADLRDRPIRQYD